MTQKKAESVQRVQSGKTSGVESQGQRTFLSTPTGWNIVQASEGSARGSDDQPGASGSRSDSGSPQAQSESAVYESESEEEPESESEEESEAESAGEA